MPLRLSRPLERPQVAIACDECERFLLCRPRPIHFLQKVLRLEHVQRLLGLVTNSLFDFTLEVWQDYRAN